MKLSQFTLKNHKYGVQVVTERLWDLFLIILSKFRKSLVPWNAYQMFYTHIISLKFCKAFLLYNKKPNYEAQALTERLSNKESILWCQ